ncbi:septation protein SepH [Corynebacterium choanae]|uniref:DUF3071 domain-containing protein n=1 Tax=Corynebacterium choanae TaxID=1862358 RepID=A0A3G6J504_9CORY|nr:septation protein SepH [Corynebacterium choanae]AZA13029.1 hypothetical protein CCHOA_03080 [Corynebacterium choanae]
MVELKIIAESSTAEQLVLTPVAADDDTSHTAAAPHTSDNSGDDAPPAAPPQQFVLPITDEIRTLLAVDTAAGHPDPTAGTTDTPAATGADAASGDTSPTPNTPAHSSETAPAPAGSTPEPSNPAPAPRTGRARDPRMPLNISPREIQLRIRRGERVSDVAARAGVSPERIKAFAVPVLRQRKNQLGKAKLALPVRGDGPARLTLQEVVDTYLVGLHLTPEDGHWDAFTDVEQRWVTTVTWAGNTDEPAQWVLQDHEGATLAALPNNPLARTITEPPTTSQPISDEQAAIILGELTPQAARLMQRPTEQRQPEPHLHTPDAAATDSAAAEQTAADTPANVTELRPRNTSTKTVKGQDLLIPDTGESAGQQRRKRRAETPNWEDILLGVRPKKPPRR